MSPNGLPAFRFPSTISSSSPSTSSSASSASSSRSSSTSGLYIDIPKNHNIVHHPRHANHINHTNHHTHHSHRSHHPTHNSTPDLRNKITLNVNDHDNSRRSETPSPPPPVFPPKVATSFTGLPNCTCGHNVHKRGCPRYAMKIRFEEGKVVVLGPSEHSHAESADMGIRLRHLGPPTDSTFAAIAEDRARCMSPVQFSPNGTLSMKSGVVVNAQVGEGYNQIMLKVDGKLLTFSRI